MTSRGVVYCDETPYPKLRLPRNWSYHHEPVWGSLQSSMQWCYETFPDASQYGWLADDTRPRTRSWDSLLEAAAGDWRLAYARDLWYSEVPHERALLKDGQNLSSGLCWGGELVRTVGWWATPGLRQAGIDTAWVNVVRPCGLFRYLHEVVVEHLNWRTGKREFDAGDEWSRGSDPYVDRDIVAARLWLESKDYCDTVRRVASAAGVEADVMVFRHAIADRLLKSGGLNATKLKKILGGHYDTTLHHFDPDPEPS